MRLPITVLIVSVHYICIESTPTPAERRLFNLLGPTTSITGTSMELSNFKKAVNLKMLKLTEFLAQS